jgi:hypothetical protein
VRSSRGVRRRQRCRGDPVAVRREHEQPRRRDEQLEDGPARAAIHAGELGSDRGGAERGVDARLAAAGLLEQRGRAQAPVGARAARQPQVVGAHAEPVAPWREPAQRRGRRAGRGVEQPRLAPGRHLDVEHVDLGIAEHARHPLAARGAVDRQRRIELQQPAGVEHGGAPAELERFSRLGRRVDHDRAARLEEAAQPAAQILAQLVVEVGQRLVEQDQAGVLGQRAGDRGALLLPAAQLGRKARQELLELENGSRVADAPIDLGAGEPAAHAQRRCDVLVDGERGVVDELLVHHRDVAALHGEPRDVDAVAQDRPVRGSVEAGQQAQQRRLAGARPPEQHGEGARREGEIDRLEVDLAVRDPGDAVQLDALCHVARFPTAAHRDGR